MRIPYAGIGSRSTPLPVQLIMSRTARFLADDGYCLRSGGAAGADAAFYSGLLPNDAARIYFPWPGFNNAVRPHHVVDTLTDAAALIARPLHPQLRLETEQSMLRLIRTRAPGLPATAKLMTRNVYQILGHDLAQPSSFVICWTPSGEPVGGTAMALRLARLHSVPVFNLGIPSVLQDFSQALAEGRFHSLPTGAPR